jgi:hypothetical protein
MKTEIKPHVECIDAEKNWNGKLKKLKKLFYDAVQNPLLVSITRPPCLRARSPIFARMLCGSMIGYFFY